MQATEKPDLNANKLDGVTDVIVRDPTNWVSLILREAGEPGLRLYGSEEMINRYRCIRRGDKLYLSLSGDLIDRIGDALTTSLTRKHVTIELTLKDVKRVKATGMVKVDTSALRMQAPEIQLFGPGALWRRSLPVHQASIWKR